MAYAWSADLETGNTAIDTQHKELIIAVNNLLDACASGKGREALKQTADFLYSYTAKHFADEEKLQLASKYPDYQNHKKEHEDFKKVVHEMVAQLNTEGPTVAMVGKVNKTIAGWLIRHIKQQDKKVAAHIRAN